MEKQKIGCAIKQIDNLITRSMISVLKKNNIDNLTPVQYWIIIYLYKHKHTIIYQKDIELLLSIRRSTACGILKVMEKNRFIKRIGSDDDRQLKIVLTDKSNSIIEYFSKEIINLENRLKANISPNDLDVFFNVLEKIKGNIDGK